MADKKTVIRATEEEKAKKIEGTLQLRDFTLGDFLTDENVKKVKESSTAKTDKDGNKIALYQSGLASREAIQEIYVPMVANFKNALGKANTQEEFDEVVNNFTNNEIEKLKADQKEMSEDFTKKTGKQFDEVTEDDFKGFSSKAKKDYGELKKINEVLNIENLDKLPLRPSTYAFTDNTASGKILENAVEDLQKKDIGKFIENNETLSQKVTLLDKDGKVKEHAFNQYQKGEQITRIEPNVHDMKDKVKLSVLKELDNAMFSQKNTLIRYNSDVKENPDTPKPDFTETEYAIKLLDEKFVKKYEVKNDNGEVDKEKTENFKELAKNFQEHAGKLFPKITDENSSEVSKYGRVAGYNPSILKDGQEKNTYFVKEMVKEVSKVVRDLPDDIVKNYKSVTNALEEKIKSDKASESTKEFAKKQLEYVNAVKSGKKEEFLAKEKAEWEEKSGKSEKNSIEDAKANQEKSEKEIEDQKKEEKTSSDKSKTDYEEEYPEYEDDTPVIEDDEFPF
jgi:hypothetical protein